MTPCEYILEKVKMTDLLEYYGITANSKKQYLCPFHDDHHPSGKVRDNYWFSCFPCQISYNVIHFVCAYEHCNKSQAKAKLDNIFNLGLGLHLTKKQKEEVQIAKKLQERKILEEKNFKAKEKFVLNKIVNELRIWENVDSLLFRMQKDIDEKQFLDLSFFATERTLWLNWLYEKCCGFRKGYYNKYDIMYNDIDTKSIIEKIYDGYMAI